MASDASEYQNAASIGPQYINASYIDVSRYTDCCVSGSQLDVSLWCSVVLIVLACYFFCSVAIISITGVAKLSL